jgi:hypothetical protein
VVGLASLAAVAVAGTAGGLGGVGAGGGGGNGGPSLMAVGHGRASSPAETALLQILLGPANYDRVMVDGSSTIPSDDLDPATAAQETVRPIVQALHAAGLPPADVALFVSPTLDPGFVGPPGGRFGARIDVTVRQPTPDRMNQVVNAAGAAAMETGMGLSQVGVWYQVADCAALIGEARRGAIEDARAKAEQQADLLGVSLGEMIESADPAESGGGEAAGSDCAPPQGNSEPASPWLDDGRVTLPTFDPSRPADASISLAVRLTFAVEA